MAHHESTHYAGEFSGNINPAVHVFERGHELFGIQQGMEMLGVPSKHHSSHITKGMPHQEYLMEANLNKNHLVASADTSTPAAAVSPWPVGDLFPAGEATTSADQSNRRLSLSLFNNMEHSNTMHQSVTVAAANLYPQQQLFMQEGRRFYYPQQQPFQIRNSKYLATAQELLNECCSLRREIENNLGKSSGKGKQWEEEQPSSSSPWNQSLFFKDVLQLQEIKTKLLAMLEEVDKRYRKYREQLDAVAASFEAVAGDGAANIYSALAAKAMSRHFRCLRDSIVAQIRVVKSAMGEKDEYPVAPGTTRGDTPRLKVLDRCIRQQKLFQQGMMEQHPWRPQRGLPERAVSVLRAWLFEHFLHPYKYPNEIDKVLLAQQTKLTKSQVSNWFINARVRLWKPMVEEMYLEEMKEFDNLPDDAPTQNEDDSNPNPNPNLSLEDKSFPPMQINDPGSLSSMLNISHRCGEQSDNMENTSLHLSQHQLESLQVSRAENFGYNGSDTGFRYNNSNTWNGVSLTLGLQQHSGGGISLSFSPNAQQSFLFSREHIEGSGGDAETLPYRRNFMGAQLLDDLGG